MKKIILNLVFTIAYIYSSGQAKTIIYTVETAPDDERTFIAVPLVIYTAGKYLEAPHCAEIYDDKENVDLCKKAKKILKPIVDTTTELTILNNGINSGTIKVIEKYNYGISDWITYSSKLARNPNVKCLTNNPILGKNKLKELKSKPTIKARKRDDGSRYTDILLTKIDIDLDGLPELIYKCEDYEGEFYRIYSFKGSSWIKVFEGGYQGV